MTSYRDVRAAIRRRSSRRNQLSTGSIVAAALAAVLVTAYGLLS